MALQDALATQIEQIVLKRIATDRLGLPPLPAVASRCLTLVRNPKVSLKQMAGALERDPMLVASMLRLANSAAYGGGGIRSIETAVTRLGMQKVTSCLLETCARRLFESRDSRINAAAAELWQHSLAVALLARDLAAFLANGTPEVAYLAGLLHDVGKPIVAAHLLEAEKHLANGLHPWINVEGWLDIVHSIHRPVGVALAEKWGLPDTVVAGIRDNGEFDMTERHSIANLIRFANALAKGEGIYRGPIDSDDVQAMIMLGRSVLEIDDDDLARVLSGLRDRVRGQLNA